MLSFLKNWKTSVCGLAGAILLGLANTPGIENASAKQWLSALGAAAIAALGASAADGTPRVNIKK